MLKPLRTAAAAALAMLASVEGGEATTPGADQAALAAQLQTAYQRSIHNDCPGSLAITSKLVGRGNYGALPERARAAGYALASFCALEAKDVPAAYRYAFDGTQQAGADPELWKLRLGLELQEHKYDKALATVEALASTHADLLNAMPVRYVSALGRELKARPGGEAWQRLLRILTAPGYEPEESLRAPDGYKRDLAVILARAGDKAAATALVARIEDPSVLVRASLDPDLRTLMPADFNARAAVERSLARFREVAASHAGSMSAVLQIARLLRQLGRAQEAVATLQASPPEGAPGQSFTDLAEQKNWWWDSMARSYQLLGRYEDTVNAFRGGVAASELGTPNVSQALNLAHAQVRFGHPAEALATIAAFQASKAPASPYGDLVMRIARGCAQAQLGNAAAAKVDVDYAQAHVADSPDALVALLLCTGEMDRAAAALIKRLDDPDLRVEALLELSDFDPPPSTLPAGVAETRFDALKLRADVQAAIRRAGGIRRFNIQDAEL